MPLNDTEFKYNGLLMGGDTDYSITKVDGLGPVDSREDELEKAIEHGSFVYAEFLTSRLITIEGFVIGNDAEVVEARLDALGSAFAPSRVNSPLTFKVPGRVEQRSYCKRLRTYWPYDLDRTLGYVEWTVSLKAGDPRFYAEVESVLNAAGVAINAGKFPTDPVITLIGPWTNPLITNDTTDEFVGVTRELLAGETLVIDPFEKDISVNGVTVYHQRTAGSSWWDLEPGNNQIVLAGSTGGTFEMRWRSAWI